MSKNKKTALISKVFVVLGPTASGKTAALASLSGDKYEVISCDSRQVYSELEIATAAPSCELIKHLPHHLLSIISPQQKFTAGMFMRQAQDAIKDIHERCKIAIVSGGAGFYFRALKTGMFPVETSPEARQKVAALSANEKLALLSKLDPQALVSAEEQASQGRIHPNDQYRITRALEIIFSTGTKKWSLFWEEVLAKQNDLAKDIDFRGFWLKPAADEAKQSIHKRAKEMVADGIVSEVGRVYQKYGDCEGLSTIGCKEALRVYLGKSSESELSLKLARGHLYYAKKQRVWFNKEKDIEAIKPSEFKMRWKMLEDS